MKRYALVLFAALGLVPASFAAAPPQPVRVLIVTGNDAHKWHNWEKTTPRIRKAVELHPRTSDLRAAHTRERAAGLQAVRAGGEANRSSSVFGVRRRFIRAAFSQMPARCSSSAASRTVTLPTPARRNAKASAQPVSPIFCRSE